MALGDTFIELGTKLFIAVEPGLPATQRVEDYAAIDMVQVRGVLTIPETGDQQEDVSEPTLEDGRVEHLFGAVDGGIIDVPVKHIENDPGQAILLSIENRNDTYCFRIEDSDGTITYKYGRVGSVRRRERTPNSFKAYIVPMAFNSEEVIVEPDGTVVEPDYTAPRPFTTGMWMLSDKPSAAGDTLTIEITSLPNNGGSPITEIQYRVGTGGVWTPLPFTGTGTHDITVPPLESATVFVRAINAIGNGNQSPSRSRTPTSNDPGQAHVFLLVGQSNMVGRASGSTQGYGAGTLQVARSGQASGGADGELVAAADPLDHWDARAGHVGLAGRFAISYKDANPDATIVLIPAAEGNTGFNSGTDWGVGLRLSEDAIARTNALLAANPSFQFKGILWHQGEADTSNPNYQAQLDAQIEEFRTRITGAGPDTPFVLGGIGDFYLTSPQRITTQEIIEGTPNRLIHTAVAPADNLAHGGDEVHFSTTALRELGNRYYTALQAAIANDTLEPVDPGDPGDPPVPTGTIEIVSHSNASSTVRQTNYTFTNVSVGAGLVVVAFAMRAPAAQDLPEGASVTVGGQEATPLAARSDSGGQSIHFFAVERASAGSVTIVARASMEVRRAGIDVWTLIGADPVGAVAAGQGQAVLPLTATVTGMVGGVILGQFLGVQHFDGITWDGLTERMPWTDFGDTVGTSCADLAVTEAGPHSVTVTGDGTSANSNLALIHIRPAPAE